MTKKILKNIYFVGCEDWKVRDFHSFTTPNGVTYNSFLILDKKKVLMDTVKETFFTTFVENIKSVISLNEIDYIIINHAEPDHASSLSKLMAKCKQAKIVCTKKCHEILAGYHDISSWNFIIVNEGNVLSIGNRTLKFIPTPMVHWPDSMFTYVEEDKILFSMDAFGQHFSSSNKFDDEVDFCAIINEAKRYYANIVMLYGKLVANLLNKLSSFDIKYIIPAHGVIWKKHIKEILSSYNSWANYQVKPKILIIYDTMWQSTKKMAEAIFNGACKDNVNVKLIYARSTDITEIATEFLDATCVAFGSSTLNKQMMPQMASVLSYLKGLYPHKKYIALFGSYGWGMGAIEDMEKYLKDSSFEAIEKSIKTKWNPSKEVLSLCESLGEKLANKALTINNN